MDRDKMLSLTPDELFERFSLSEVRQIKNVFIDEMKSIRETLRTVINEKYEDFIEATGKVDDMKTNDIARGVDCIYNQYMSISADKCFYDRNSDSFERNIRESEYIAAALIKLLIDITEQIWCIIDDNDYISAILLLQLCGHIKTVLEIDASLNLKDMFPVVYEQWNIIMKFPVILISKIENTLLNISLTPEDCNRCLCSVMLLENLQSSDLLERFLSLRSKALEHCFKRADNIKQNQNVKTNLIDGLQVVCTTLQLVYRCFIENSSENEETLWFYMKTVDKYMKSVFDLVRLDHSYAHAESYVPLIVKEFKVTLNRNSVQTVNVDEIQRSVSDWLNSIKIYITREAVALLNIVSSVKLLKSIKRNCQIFPENWSAVTEVLNLPRRFNLWQEFFDSLMVDRAKEILSDNWNFSFVYLKREIDTLILNRNKQSDKELNLHAVIWRNNQDSAVQNTDDKNKRDLLVKIEGLFPESTYMCESMEKYISSIVQDISDLCDEQDIEDDKIVALKNFQQHCCFHFVIRVVEYVSNIALSESTTSKFHCVLIAKFLHGVTLLCPSLKDCLLFVVDNKGSKWLEMKCLLQEKSECIWKRWISQVLPGVVDTFKCEIDLRDNSGLQIKIIPKWNTFTIEETNEDGQVIQSTVRVPFSVTFPLQRLLNELNVCCSQILPPKPIIRELVSNAVTEILRYYDKCCDYSLPQVHYIQFMFDVMYIISLLIPVENKHALSKCQDTISKLESKIDPFDLDAISQYLMNNVKLYVNRTQAVYGLIAMNKTSTGVMSTGTPGSDDPNILNMSLQNIPWFPLLPITTRNL